MGFVFGSQKANHLDINAILQENEAKERICFDVEKQTKQVELLLKSPRIKTNSLKY